MPRRQSQELHVERQRHQRSSMDRSAVNSAKAAQEMRFISALVELH